MSLSVRAVQIIDGGRTTRIEGSAMKPAGFERWRTNVWASSAVISRAEAVRRPRPSRLILPSLATQDILVEGEELDQLEREVDVLLADVLDVVQEILRTAPMVGIIVDQDGSHAPSESENVEGLRSRLLDIREAVQLARTVPRGAVEIA